MKHSIVVVLILFCICSCAKNNDDNPLVKKGDTAFARREYTKAANIWTSAHQKNPENIMVMQKLGSVYVKLGRIERAKHFLKKAVEVSPDAVNAHLELARLNILTLDFTEAEATINVLDKQGFEDPELSLLKADVYLMKQQADNAEVNYRKAVIESKDSIKALLKLAIFLKSENRDQEADEIFNIVIANTIENTQLFLLMADYYLLDDKPGLAESSILSAINLEPEEIGLKYYLLNYYITAEKNDNAVFLIKKMLEFHDDELLWMTLADIYLLKHRFQDAEAILDKLNERIKEKNAEFELLKGKFWLYSGKPVFATSHLKNALRLKPGLTNTYYLLGLTHLINGKAKLSENSLLQAIELQPDHHDARLLICQLLYRKKEYQLSIKYLDEFLKLYPEEFTGRLLYGLNFLGMSEYSQAEKQFQKAMKLSLEKQYVAQYYLGFSKEKQKEYDQALQNYSAVLVDHPNFIEVSYRYCLMLVKTGDLKKAREFMDERLASSPESSQLCYLFSKVAGQMQDKTEQEKLLKKAIALPEASGVVYMVLANLYKEQNKFSRALMTLKECTRENPEFEDAWLALSQCYLDGEDIDSALKILEEGLPIFKESPLFQSNLAWLYLESGKELDKALHLAQTAYDKMPDRISVADTLAWAYYHKGIYSQAQWLLNDIEKKAPDNGYIKYHLGMTYYHQGNFGKAKLYLEEVQDTKLAINFYQQITDTLELIEKKSKDSDQNRIEAQGESMIADPQSDTLDQDSIQPSWWQH